MRFSSISLIAATLAAIAMAAPGPGPLHACALGQVNPFEREVDSDKLFKRGYHKGHELASRAISLAAKASHAATQEAQKTAKFLTEHPQYGLAEPWEGHHHQQTELTEYWLQRKAKHRKGLLHNIRDDIKFSEEQTARSYGIAADARHTRRHESKEDPITLKKPAGWP